MKILRTSDVFVTGGLPKYTYVPRAGRRLEQKLMATRNNHCKIATVTGATKTGKTVLVRKLFHNFPHVWIDGGFVHKESDFWEITGTQIQTNVEVEFSSSEETDVGIGAEASAGASVLFAKGETNVSTRGEWKTSAGQRRKMVSSTPWKVTQDLKRSHTAVIIDDFHYIPRLLQGTITRALKPLVFEGLPVIYLAIPHRRYDAIKVEREMNGRIELVEVPSWNETELTGISELGFPLLNIDPHFDTSSRLARESQGSPHLMQEFCRDICAMSGVVQTSAKAKYIDSTFDYEIIFHRIAKDLGKNIYEKLARGPRTRTDRRPRKLKNGQTADIYKVVLLALADLKPDVSTIEYEPLRAAIRNVLDDELPQAHEVARVLEQMAKISTMDESSVPVIDYEKDERKLHITDPFFAFFLKWGNEVMI